MYVIYSHFKQAFFVLHQNIQSVLAPTSILVEYEGKKKEKA
jgi:hypothetical protein